MLQYYKIIRPTTCIFVSLITYLGFILSERETYYALPSLIVNVLTMASMNTINDIFDYNIDKIVFPDRPLTSGKLTRHNAIIYYILLNIVSIYISYKIGLYNLYLHFLAIFLGFIYTPILKYLHYFTKNACAGIIGFIYLISGIKNINLLPIYIPIWLFIDCFNYEVYKDIRDIEADKKYKCYTIPVVYGVDYAICIAWANYIISSFIILFLNYKIGIPLFFIRIFGNIYLDTNLLLNSPKIDLSSSFRYKKKILVFINLFIILVYELTF